MGDTATNICDHETSIMLALSAFVLERSVLILDIAHSLCQLDCLLSLATVARENNWCRPDVVDQGTANYTHHSKTQKDGWAKYIPNFGFE